jgi:hypothetical protein
LDASNNDAYSYIFNTLNTNGKKYFTIRKDRPGIQELRIPKSGTYRIEAAGACGGYRYTSNNPKYYLGGRGAIISGNKRLNKDDIIYIAVGQAGRNSYDKGNLGGGGGGASMVIANQPNHADESDIIVIAGGGGYAWGFNDGPFDTPGPGGETVAGSNKFQESIDNVNQYTHATADVSGNPGNSVTIMRRKPPATRFIENENPNGGKNGYGGGAGGLNDRQNLGGQGGAGWVSDGSYNYKETQHDNSAKKYNTAPAEAYPLRGGLDPTKKTTREDLGKGVADTGGKVGGFGGGGGSEYGGGGGGGYSGGGGSTWGSVSGGGGGSYYYYMDDVSIDVFNYETGDGGNNDIYNPNGYVDISYVSP